MAQTFRHPVDAHWKAPQSCALAAGQAPAPSQVAAGVNVCLSALQEAGVQILLLLTLRQAPVPSQVPSLPHGLVAVSSVQVSCGS